MVKSLAKQSWLERAINTHNYHCACLKEDEKHTVEDTASSLRRSLGSISEDLLIASWSTKEDKIKEFKYAKDALAFIRSKKKKMMTEISID